MDATDAKNTANGRHPPPESNGRHPGPRSAPKLKFNFTYPATIENDGVKGGRHRTIEKVGDTVPLKKRWCKGLPPNVCPPSVCWHPVHYQLYIYIYIYIYTLEEGPPLAVLAAKPKYDLVTSLIRRAEPFKSMLCIVTDPRWMLTDRWTATADRCGVMDHIFGDMFGDLGAPFAITWEAFTWEPWGAFGHPMRTLGRLWPSHSPMGENNYERFWEWAIRSIRVATVFQFLSKVPSQNTPTIQICLIFVLFYWLRDRENRAPK